MKNKLYNILGWTATTISIIGTILNANLISLCFILWIISNAIFTYINIKEKKWFYVVQFSFLLIMSIYGYINWTNFLN